MTLTFLQLAEKVLQEERRPLTPEEIWEIVLKKGYDKLIETRGKTPWRTLAAELYVCVRDKPDGPFIAVEGRPKRFSLRSLEGTPEGPKPPNKGPSPDEEIAFSEKDLHPFLAYYGYYYLQAYLKTIHHSKSGKKEFGEWTHPDMVGCRYPFGDWLDEVVEVSSLMGNAALTLFSFEIKRELSFANLREAFFQAVSNSSWAHQGYLVVAEIDTNTDFRTELERLSTSFGIGVIRIDVGDPNATEILYPARYKASVDWETVNKLASLNPDFRAFLKRIKTDLTSKEIYREWYDKVLDEKELIHLIAEKKKVKVDGISIPAGTNEERG